MITPAQCRAARGLLGWTQKDLARRCTMSMRTIITFEMSKTTPTPLNMKTLQEKLEEGGAEFTDMVEGKHQEGVRLKWGHEAQRQESENTDA
jgi:transcriptional regulator with XRE-family HTH domain